MRLTPRQDRTEQRQRAVAAGRWLMAGLLVLGVAGCAGYEKEKIHQKYAGATVADKKIVSKTRYEPIRIVSYVLPNGQIICEGEYGEIRVSCAMQKAQIEKKYNIKVREIVRDSGQTRPVQYDEHYLVLKHPDGTVSTQQVNDVQFRESLIGERLGLKSTDPTARRAALTTEITAAEKDLEGASVQREAKSREKERAERELAALERPAKGRRKGSAAELGKAQAEVKRLSQELDGLTMDEEDKQLRLTQLREERENIDNPKPQAGASQQPQPQPPPAPVAAP